MPQYTYAHPETGEEIDVIQSMNEEHKYIDKDGVEWERVFLIPNAQIDSQIDPCDEKAFVEKTGNQKGTVGDLWEQSKELSEKRKDRFGGKDPVKANYLKKKYHKGKIPFKADDI